MPTTTRYPHGAAGDRQRMQDVMALYNEGRTFEEIAEQCGYASRAGARRAVLFTAPRILGLGGIRDVVADMLARRFGLEIEYIGPNRSTIARAISAAGVDAQAEDYNHQLRDHWKIVPDGSVSRGAEVVSPVLEGVDGMAATRTVLGAMRNARCSVNTTTGLHVHHEVSDLSAAQIAQVVLFYQDHQAAIDCLVSESRRSSYGNTYCQQYTPSEQEQLRLTANGRESLGRYFDRYRMVNTQSYFKYGTLEFRQHQGTTASDKVEAWVRFGQSLIEVVKRGKNAEPIFDGTLENLLRGLVEHGDLDARMSAFLLDRAEQGIRPQPRPLTTVAPVPIPDPTERMAWQAPIDLSSRSVSPNRECCPCTDCTDWRCRAGTPWMSQELYRAQQQATTPAF